MEQLLLHLLGDYITQTDKMATKKTTEWKWAISHAAVYSLPFVLLTHHVAALAVIFGTHAVIDRFRLARFVVWFKNALTAHWASVCLFSPKALEDLQWLADNDNEVAAQYVKELEPFRWKNCKATGYPAETPVWLAVWLTIICDNTLHLLINYGALRWL